MAEVEGSRERRPKKMWVTRGEMKECEKNGEIVMGMWREKVRIADTTCVG